jgi:hypothetical protein
MSQQLDRITFGSHSGTIVGGTFDTSRFNMLEVYARGGSQIGTVTASAVVTIDVYDSQGNKFAGALGTALALAVSGKVARSYFRGQNIGAADPAVLGQKASVQAVITGSMEIGVVVVGYLQ